MTMIKKKKCNYLALPDSSCCKFNDIFILRTSVALLEVLHGRSIAVAFAPAAVVIDAADEDGDVPYAA